MRIDGAWRLCDDGVTRPVLWAEAQVVFDSHIRMRRNDGQTVLFHGQFAAATETTALDMSVLGRDITNLLALVVDRPSNVVCLLSRGEQYTA